MCIIINRKKQENFSLFDCNMQFILYYLPVMKELVTGEKMTLYILTFQTGIEKQIIPDRGDKTSPFYPLRKPLRII